MAEDGSLDEAGFLENLTRINQAKDRRPAPSELHPVQPTNAARVRPAEHDPGARRALTDLFPPAEHERPPGPLRGTATFPVLPAPTRAAEPVHAGDDSAGYETFYGFHDRPFGPAPDLRFLYHSAAHDAASEALLTAITRRDAVTVLTAPSGAGKTLLCAAVIDQLDRRTMTSVIRDPFLTLDDLLERMLIDFGVVSREDTRAKGGRHDALTAALQSFSSSLAPLQAAAVIVIDDAHRLAADVIDHLDILTSGGGGALVLILLGEPGLLKMLKRPALRALDERIAARIELGPLAGDEMPGYIAHRLRVAGDAARVQFDDEAIEVISTLSKRVPGAVNAICDRALSHGLESSAAAIDATLVEQASRDLGLVSARDKRAAILTLFFYLGLMLAGAATAAWLFWDKVEQVLHRFNW